MVFLLPTVWCDYSREGSSQKNVGLLKVIGQLSCDTGFVRVLENLESPGILFCHFSGLESAGKRPLVLESAGNLLNSTKCSNRQLSNLYTVDNPHYQPS